jgi:hypothetical protein
LTLEQVADEAIRDGHWSFGDSSGEIEEWFSGRGWPEHTWTYIHSKLRKGFGAVYFKLVESKAAIAASAAAEEAGSTAQHVAEVSARAAGVAAGCGDRGEVLM